MSPSATDGGLQRGPQRVPLIPIVTVLLIVLASIALALWFSRGVAPGAGTASPSAEASEPAAATDIRVSPEPTHSRGASDEDVPPADFTARRWYGNDKTISFSHGTAKALMHVKGTWDHKTCAGTGRSAAGRKAPASRRSAPTGHRNGRHVRPMHGHRDGRVRPGRGEEARQGGRRQLQRQVVPVWTFHSDRTGQQPPVRRLRSLRLSAVSAGPGWRG
jgi:hypothetical protein